MDIVANRNRLNNIRKLILVNTYFDFTLLDKQFIENSGENIDSYSEDAIKRVKDGLLEGSLTSKQLDIILKADLSDKLKNIDVNTLIIGSDKDGFFSVEKFVELKNNIEFSELHIVKNARHLGFITHIKEIKGVIGEWEWLARGDRHDRLYV